MLFNNERLKGSSSLRSSPLRSLSPETQAKPPGHWKQTDEGRIIWARGESTRVSGSAISRFADGFPFPSDINTHSASEGCSDLSPRGSHSTLHHRPTRTALRTSWCHQIPETGVLTGRTSFRQGTACPVLQQQKQAEGACPLRLYGGMPRDDPAKLRLCAGYPPDWGKEETLVGRAYAPIPLHALSSPSVRPDAWHAYIHLYSFRV